MSHGFATIDQIDLEVLKAFRSARAVSARTWTKELGTIRHFFRHCLDNEWVLRSWAYSAPRHNYVARPSSSSLSMIAGVILLWTLQNQPSVGRYFRELLSFTRGGPRTKENCGDSTTLRAHASCKPPSRKLSQNRNAAQCHTAARRIAEHAGEKALWLNPTKRELRENRQLVRGSIF